MRDPCWRYYASPRSARGPCRRWSVRPVDKHTEEIEKILGDTANWEKCVAAKTRLDAIQEEMSTKIEQSRKKIQDAMDLETAKKRPGK